MFLTSRGVIVPLNFTLGRSATIVRTVPLLLIDLETEHGLTGHPRGRAARLKLSSCATFAKIAMSLRSIMLQLSH
jgi:hypothetical protein